MPSYLLLKKGNSKGQAFFIAPVLYASVCTGLHIRSHKVIHTFMKCHTYARTVPQELLYKKGIRYLYFSL